MELGTNIVQSTVFLYQDLLEEVTEHIVGVCLEVVCYSLQDLNERKNSSQFE